MVAGSSPAGCTKINYMNDPKVFYLLTCSTVVRDQFSNNSSYIDIFEKINIPLGRDFVFYSFWVVGRINDIAIGTQVNITINIFDPKNVSMGEVRIQGMSNTKDLNILGFFEGLRFSEVGKHYIKIFVNGQNIDKNQFFFEVGHAS